MGGYYPESKVEVKGFTAVHYDALMDIGTFGSYSRFLNRAVELMGIRPADRILDFGAGTGRNACVMARCLSREGGLTGVDISSEMVAQFEKKCAGFPNVRVVRARIDRPLPFEEKFDKAFISFVIHGFPQDAREAILESVLAALKTDGHLFILDYSEFSLEDMPFYLRVPFKAIECPYAFDFIARDWKQILAGHGFADFEESFFFRDYVRLLKARKTG